MMHSPAPRILCPGRCARLRGGLFALVLALSLAPAGADVPATAAASLAKKQVLLLSPYGFGREGVDQFNQRFYASLNQAGLPGESLMIEYLALNRIVDPAGRARLRELLLGQYRGRKLDLIVTVQSPALEFFVNELKELAPGAPLMALNAEASSFRSSALHPLLHRSSTVDFRGTVAQAMSLFPGTRRVVVVLGVGAADQALKRKLDSVASTMRQKVQLEYTDQRSLDDTLAYVASLPGDALVVYGLVNADIAGKLTTPMEFAAKVARAASVPVFGLFSPELEKGFIGGSMLDIDSEAQAAARSAIDLLRGAERLPSGVTVAPSQGIPMYHWGQLQRWQADLSRLPAGALLVGRPPSLWEEHGTVASLASGVLAVLIVLVAVLLVQRLHMRRVEARHRDSERRFRVLVEHAPEAILVYDLDLGRFTDANAKAEQLLACSRALLLDGGPERFYTPSAGDALEHNRQRALDGEELVFERTVQAMDGRLFPCQISLVRLPAHGRRQLRASCVDISARKQAENELLRHRDHLEELVEERTRALSVAMRAAQAANRAKSVFLANMSHELRTPLNSVIGFSQMMSDAPGMAAQERDNLGIINRSGHHLLALINDILELSKIEAGRAELQLVPVDLSKLLHEVLDAVRLRAGEYGVALGLDLSGPVGVVLIDAAKLRQVLLKLLSNALKFAPGGTVSLALDCRPRADGTLDLAFAVRDTGVGIASADHERIFEPFVQASSSASQAGTGLGLSIAREFVSLMGGTLTLSSRPGMGACFQFSLRAPASGAGEAPPDCARVVGLPREQRGKRILVFDETAEGSSRLAAMLEPLGFFVSQAASAREFQALVMSKAFELVLLDWRADGKEDAHGMGAMALLGWLPSTPLARQAQVAVLAAPGVQDSALAMAAGADAVLHKPVEANKLFTLIEQVLGLHFIRHEDMAVLSPNDSATLDAGALVALGAPVRAALQRAVRELDMVKAKALLANLKGDDAALAQSMQGMLDQHQHQRLWQLLEQSAGGSRHG